MENKIVVRAWLNKEGGISMECNDRSAVLHILDPNVDNEFIFQPSLSDIMGTLNKLCWESKNG